MNTIEQAREVAKRLSIGATIARERRIDHEFAVLADHASSAIESLIAELATLKAVALSDDGAGGEGMMLYIRNRELNAELARLKGQKPVAWQYRCKANWVAHWGLWQDCTAETAASYQRTPELHDWKYEVRQLFLAVGAQTKPKWNVLAITTAYEQGFGKGIQAKNRGTEISNPYAEGDCREAWAYGYEEGNDKPAPVQAVVKDSLTTQEPTPLEVRLVDALLGQAQEPFAPDWAGYRQGKADGIAEAQERKPLSDEQIRELRRALPYGGEDKPEPWAFEIGVRAAERHHGIKEQP